MKKILIALLISFGILVTLTACGNNETSNLHLTIKYRGWASTDRMQAPEEEESFDVKLNEKYVVNEGHLGLTFTITKVNEDSIIIKTTEPFSDSETGINLRTDKTEFTIEKGNSITLTTPTMDAGEIYTLILN